MDLYDRLNDLAQFEGEPPVSRSRADEIGRKLDALVKQHGLPIAFRGGRDYFYAFQGSRVLAMTGWNPK